MIYATGTTLGADDGIAVALAFAILEDSTLSHPELEVVITTDEEVGMTGAHALDTSDLKAKYMINIETLNISGHSAVSLDLGNNLKLQSVDCSNNMITTLILPTSLINLNCSDNYLKILETSHMKNLTDLDCSNNYMTVLDIRENSKISNINVNYCPLTSLSISGNITGLIGQYVIPNKTGGIIFYANNIVKIVALKQQSCYWSTEARLVDTSSSDGIFNMSQVQMLDNWETLYPAFYYCATYGDGNWYLGAWDEVLAIYNAGVASIVKEFGGKIGSERFWSSTSTSKTDAKYKHFVTGYNGSQGKGQSGEAAPIRVL
jgi:hypothetical protein